MSRKCPLLSANNERETRGENTERTEIEQRKNKETRRIFSLIISRQIRQIRHLKKGKCRRSVEEVSKQSGQIGHLKKGAKNAQLST
jgi:hypothetical protein